MVSQNIYVRSMKHILKKSTSVALFGRLNISLKLTFGARTIFDKQNVKNIFRQDIFLGANSEFP